MVQAQGTWTEKVSFPTHRWAAVAFSIGEYGYAGTGAGNDSALSDFWRYDPKNDVWQEIASMPTVGRYGAFSFVIDRLGYVGLGITNDNPDNHEHDNELWVYDPAYDKWGRKENVPHLVFSYGTLKSFSIGAHGYLVAPYNPSNFFQYDPETDTWTPRSNYPGNGGIGTVALSIGNKGYIGSGFGGNNFTDEFWEYDPETDTWAQKADIPGPLRDYGTGFSIGNCGYIGLGWGSGVAYNDFWEYHQPTNTWRQIADCNYFSANAFAMTIRGKGYVGTGNSYSGREFFEYTPDFSGVQLTQQSTHFSVFPNPASNTLMIRTDIPLIHSSTIFNSQGQAVMKYNSNVRTIDVSRLSTGVYWIVCQTTDCLLNTSFIKD